MNNLVTALKRFSSLPPFTRFVWGFGITYFLSLLWPISLYFACSSCPSGAEYFRQLLNNEQTYTTAHHLFFAPAVGLFLASVSAAVIDSIGRWSALVLLLLIALATGLAYQDAFYGTAGSHQLRGACSFLDTEYKLRERSVSPDANFDADRNAFQSSKTRAGIADTLKRINFNGFVSGLLTWLFLVFAGVFIWYSWATAFSATIVIRQHLQLIVVALLLILWIPLRVYTDWYQNYWQMKNWADAPAVFGVIIALMMTAFYSATAIHWYLRKDSVKTMAGIGVAIGAFISFLFAVIPKWAPEVHDKLNRLWPSMILCFGVVGVLLIMAVAWPILGKVEMAEHIED